MGSTFKTMEKVLVKYGKHMVKHYAYIIRKIDARTAQHARIHREWDPLKKKVF